MLLLFWIGLGFGVSKIVLLFSSSKFLLDFHFELSVKKLECLDIKIIIKTKENEKIVNVDDKEENVNEEIILQNDEHDDNIELDGIDWER